ncbi:hypothetical protein BC830DRAFT_475892 [Chytriomyces sp. MP71]|nr:hypothetical protein BC830DRAFT_475892 [Chytriomyces sp. MP71]
MALPIDPNETLISESLFNALTLGILVRPAFKMAFEVRDKPRPLIFHAGIYSSILKSVLSLIATYATISSSSPMGGMDFSLIDQNAEGLAEGVTRIVRDVAMIEIIARRSRATYPSLLNSVPVALTTEAAIGLSILIQRICKGLAVWHPDYSLPGPQNTALLTIAGDTDFAADIIEMITAVVMQIIFFIGLSKFIYNRIKNLGAKFDSKIAFPFAAFTIETLLLVISLFFSIAAYWNGIFDDISDMKRVAFALVLVDILEFGDDMREIGKPSKSANSGHTNSHTPSTIKRGSEFGEALTLNRQLAVGKVSLEKRPSFSVPVTPA